MVFKPFTTLARQSISKTIVNGYVQSVVAASQSSYASTTLPIHRIGQNGTPARLHNAFGGSSSGSTASGKDGQGADGLSSFYAAKGDGLDNEKDSKKYLFSRKILWSRAQHQEQQKKLLQPPKPIDEGVLPLSRANSSLSAVSEADIEEIRTEAAEHPEDVSEAVEIEVEVGAGEAAPRDAQHEPVTQPSTLSVGDVLMDSAEESSSATEHYNEQLHTLSNEGRYPEVSAVFQLMVQEGVQPNTSSFNLLLSAIVHLEPRGVTDVVSIYKDMLRQKLIPNTTTYSILVDFLASRAIKALRLASDLEADATRFGGMLPSVAQKVEDLKNEGSLVLALDLFYASTEVRMERAFPEYVYLTLLEACSKYGREDDMIKVYAHMEAHDVAPSAEIMQSLVRGFGQVGNINCAIESYNAYTELAIASDPARMDERYNIYCDLIKAYMDCGDSAGALQFLEKVTEMSRERSRCEALAQTVAEGFLVQGDVSAAQSWIERQDKAHITLDWLSQMIVKAADMGQREFAISLYAMAKELGTTGPSNYRLAHAQMALLALCVRDGLIDKARDLWYDLAIHKLSAGPDVPAAVAYITMLFHVGLNNEATVVLNQFSEFYLNTYVQDPESNMDNYFMARTKISSLEEVYDYLIVDLSNRSLLTPGIALDIAGFSWYRCGGLRREASMRVLSLFDAPRLLGLTTAQLALVVGLQVNVLRTTADLRQPIRPEDAMAFNMMFDVALTANHDITSDFVTSIETGVSILGNPELSSRWSAYIQSRFSPASTPMEHPATPAMASEVSPTLVQSEIESISPVDDTFDPYWGKTDVRTSHAVENIIDRSKSNRVSEVRRMYRATRKGGKALRMTTLGKIVTAAARAGNYEDFIDEIYRNARQDMPLVADNNISRFGWCALLDSLVAAQLNLRRSTKAAMYHDEMLKMGAAPSANTYGLYIVSLKGTHQTFDEASEAVKIFQRAKRENVLPSSFLYNALIGKLAKARRVDDCLYYFAEMRSLGIRPTSVTYGTMINALTRVGDETFAEELFQEMEAMPNYKPRAAPYNSLMQFFISTKRDRSKVLSYHSRMVSLGIQPTPHTHKLLIEAYATLDPPDLPAAEKVLDEIRAARRPVESAHHAALIHAKGCVLHDVDSAIAHFESVLSAREVTPDSTLYQSLLETLVANHRIHETPQWVVDMKRRGVVMTPYIANTLIHGWALDKNIAKAKELYSALSKDENSSLRREPSTYEAMTRAYLAVEDKAGAMEVVSEMMTRGYPPAVMARVLDLVNVKGGVPATAAQS